MGPKGKKKKDDDKKDKKNEADIPEEVLVSTTDLEQEPEEVQFTDTSYTSASFETLPPPPEEPKIKPKRKKKRAEEEIKKQSSELFQWSEESLPQEEDEEEKKPEPLVAEVKKKKEKGKKKGKKEDEIPSFEKPKNWKNMDKKARDAWLALRIEEWREEQEAAKQAAIAGAKEKRARLAKERAELMVKDNAEQEIRRDILDKTCTLFQGYEDQKRDYDNVKQRSEEWAQYLRCDGLPDPRVVTQMSTYLHMWRDRATYDDNELQKKCLEVLPMLDMLEEFVANARQYTERQAHNYNEVRLQLRAQLSTAIEFASYHLLRDIEKRLTRESIKLSTYGRQFEGLKLTLWVAVKMPTRLPKAVEPNPEPVELAFPSILVTLKLPTIIDASCICVRASRSMIDLVSEKSKTFALAREVPNRYEDLFTFCEKEHAETYKLKKEQDVIRTTFYRQLRERVRELEALLKTNVYAQFTKEKEELEELSLAEPPFLPDPRTFIGEQNELKFKKFLKACNLRTKTGELNLRKYRICGGVLNLDLLMTPPQPKRMRWEVELSTLELPKQLKPIDYKVQYRTPLPPGPGVTRTPEEIEAEMKKIEAEYEKLALVSIDLPNEVMWFEPPVICQWQEPRKLWTSNYVNDYKYNEDKLTVQFRTGVLWPIGIATLRYSNLPYQGWDMRPAPKGDGVLITVTGICATVSWLCTGSSVKLMRNVATPALKEHFNKKYSVKRMVQIMREAAVDFFPDFDAYNYVEGSCHKEWVAERHNYHAMAFLSRAYNFQWSRWNVGAGSRNIIMQIREAVDPKREAKLSLLCASPTRAYIMKCNEMSQEFDFDPMPGMLFYPDLFTMNLTYGSVDARRQTFGQKFKLVESVFGMLQELKLSSFS